MQLCGADKPYLSPEKLEEKHREIMQACLEQFQSTKKMGGEVFSRTFEEHLQQQIKESYESYMKRNESKHILHAYRTPAVLFTVMVVSYFISSLLDMFGVESLSQTAIFGLYLPLLFVVVWAYVRYSGNFREVGQAIDNMTSMIWEEVREGIAGLSGSSILIIAHLPYTQVLQPLYAKILERSLQQAVKLGTKQKSD